MKLKSLCLFCVLSCLSSLSFAETGAALTLPISSKDPTNLHGYRIAFWHQPEAWIWSHMRVYWDASFGHWGVSSNSPHKEMNIYSLAPTFRYNFKRFNNITPFVNLSIGISYLSSTYISDRNLGMHFSFQDEAGIGVTVGKDQKFSAILSALHYSNCSMARKNAGITIPLLVSFSYRF